MDFSDTTFASPQDLDSIAALSQVRRPYRALFCVGSYESEQSVRSFFRPNPTQIKPLRIEKGRRIAVVAINMSKAHPLYKHLRDAGGCEVECGERLSQLSRPLSTYHYVILGPTACSADIPMIARVLEVGVNLTDLWALRPAEFYIWPAKSGLLRFTFAESQGQA